jgi:SecD/SecF fusion protein
MNRNNVWRFFIVVLVVLWSLYEMNPPKAQDLVEHFYKRAKRQQGVDPVFAEIIRKARELQTEAPGKSYDNLVAAIGTNDITGYFPFFEAKEKSKPTAFILNKLQREAAGRIKLGIDLVGGTSFLVKMDTSTLTNSEDKNNALQSQAVEVLRKRVDNLGVAEPVIQPQGNETILVQLPGMGKAEQESAENSIKRAAFLEFRLVEETSDQDIESGSIKPGCIVLSHQKKAGSGQERVERVEVRKGRPEMDGSSIKSAMVVRGNLGEPQIDFALSAAGTDRFAELTRASVGRRLAIILDGELYSAPVIRQPIENGRGQITGDFEIKEALELANILENPLKTPLTVISREQVDPTLGRDAIRSGINAAIYGTLAVAVFMLVYYMIAGMVANVALFANIIILLGVMCSVGTTLTLPGIAGIVLTVGMAVDANVLIYERIREETAKGKSLRGAISAGYARAFGTIFDSHITTLISSVILIFMGTGPIKGFGVALTIGVAASLFTALVVTRLIFDWLLNRGMLKSIKMMHLIPATMKLDFMKLAVPAFITSWLIIVIGLGFGLHRGKSAFGRDFVGGDSVSFSFEKQVPSETIRAALEKQGVKDPLIQYKQNLATGLQTLRVDSLPEIDAKGESHSLADKVKTTVEGISEGKFKSIGQSTVGATVGQEIQRSAIIASLLSLFGILVYVAFRYEFSFAVGAVLAVIHDVLMTIGIYYLSGRQFNATTVAAILTIIGFSTNDTIVIFDRIREDLRLGVRGTFKELVNQALNQTLSRTIITSGTVFLATLSLFIFGGGEINDFAFTFLIGIITGTYSSIYIASALVLWWHKGQRPAIGTGPIQAQTVSAPAGK